jgi:hypothetical protein
MKKSALIFALLFIFNSCSKDSEVAPVTEYSGKWTLVKMSGSMANSETTGSAMQWQEFYVFGADGTFTKSREINATKTSASGTYTSNKRSDVIYLELSYPQDNDIIGNCYGNQKEELYLTINNLLSSTWKNCDGPELEYEKTN